MGRRGRIKHIAVGGAPYSEGIYEDLNKAICTRCYWDPERKGKLEVETLKSAFAELTRIYHAENAHSMPIKPPQLE